MVWIVAWFMGGALGAWAEPVSVFDFHVHAPAESWFLDSFLNREFVTTTWTGDVGPWVEMARIGGLVISPTHRTAWAGQFIVDGRYTEVFDQLNRAVSTKILALNRAQPGVARAVCGVALGLSNTQEKARLCLGLPGFVGFKLREEALAPEVVRDVGSREEGEDTTQPWRDFKFLAELANAQQGVMLIHFLSVHHLNQMDSRIASQLEAEALALTAHANPHVTFIIAHSGELSVIGPEQLLQLSVYDNIFLETSAADPILLRVWRKFGMKRVVFGSDDTGTAEDLNAPAYFSLIWNNIFLTSAEIQNILFSNGRDLWEHRVAPEQRRKSSHRH